MIGYLESSHLVLILDRLMSRYWRMLTIQVLRKPQTIAISFLAINKNNKENYDVRHFRSFSLIKIWLWLGTSSTCTARGTCRLLRHLVDGNVCDRLWIRRCHSHDAHAHSHRRWNVSTAADESRTSPPAQALGDRHDPLHKQHHHPPPTTTTLQDARFHPTGSIASMLYHYNNRHHNR